MVSLGVRTTVFGDVFGFPWEAEKYSRSNDKFGLGLRRGIMWNNSSTYFYCVPCLGP